MSTMDNNQIMNKVRDFSRTQDGQRMMDDRIAEYRRTGVRRTGAGDVILTDDTMHEIAYELIRNLQQMAEVLEMSRVLPHSVAAHFQWLSAEVIRSNKDGSCTIGIFFDDDLHRDSLIGYGHDGSMGTRTGDGVDNIIALFNEGYNAAGAVHGFWESAGIFTWSLRVRPHLGFMQGEIDRFNARYNRSVCHAELMW